MIVKMDFVLKNRSVRLVKFSLKLVNCLNERAIVTYVRRILKQKIHVDLQMEGLMDKSLYRDSACLEQFSQKMFRVKEKNARVHDHVSLYGYGSVIRISVKPMTPVLRDRM